MPLPFYEGEAPQALPVEGATRAPIIVKAIKPVIDNRGRT
jgi:hypothetical protein